MSSAKVGILFIPGVTPLTERTIYNYTSSGHTLTLCVASPTRKEIDAIKNQEAVFALLARENTLFLLAKFGSIPWQASHYNWWINAPMTRPDPWSDLHSLNSGIAVSVCLVNAATGVLEALRAVTFSREFSRVLLETVLDQTGFPFDPGRYAEVVDEVLHGFAKGTDIVKEAHWMCHAG